MTTSHDAFTIPRISVVIPAYNVASYIEETVNALLNQAAYAFYEIIIVDDGSTDETWSILQSYANNPLVVLIHTDNHGCGIARNIGTEKASGEWIYYCDGDDTVSPNFVETIIKEIEQHTQLDLIFFAAHTVYEGPRGNFQPDYTRPITGKFKTGMETFSALIDAEALEPSTCLYISRRSLWGPEKLTFLPYYHEDEALILSLCATVGETMILANRLYTRRVRAQSLMTSAPSAASADGVFQAFLSTIETIRTHHSLRTQYARLMRRRLFILIEIYMSKCRKLHIRPHGIAIIFAYLRLWWKPPLHTLWESR
jgi:glycosyltransferase involved in cell wall biosynthesis